MKPLLRASLLILALAHPALWANETATERWFQIEMLIFENPALESDNPEQWPTFAALEHPQSYRRLDGVADVNAINAAIDDATAAAEIPASSLEIEIIQLADRPEAFVALAEVENQLMAQRRMLEADDNYRLLFHAAWNQPVPGRDEVVPIRIDAGERYGRHAELQGYISLYVERYLHFSADLYLIDYQRSDNPFDIIEGRGWQPNSEPLGTIGSLSLTGDPLMARQPSMQQNEAFFVSKQAASLQERRRMRSRTLHYFDSPAFGILLLITPIELQ